jgi:hypothetical protein
MRPVFWMGLALAIGTGPGVARSLAEETRCAVLEVFVRGDAERSQEAKDFIEKTYGDRKHLRLAVRDVTEDEAALDRFYKLADHFKIEKPGLPAFYASGVFEMGWDEKITPKRLEEALTVEVFVRQGCPRCAAARPLIFDRLAKRYPGYKFVAQDIAVSAEARSRLEEVTQRYHVQAASVPALHFCGQVKVGFLDADTSYKQWDDVLKAVTVACPPEKKEKKSSDRRDLSRPSIRVAAAPAWMVGIYFAAQPSDESRASSGESREPEESESAESDAGPPPPVVELPSEAETPLPPLPSDDQDTDTDSPPPRRSLPPEIPPETEPLALPTIPSAQADPEVVQLPFLGAVRWRAWGMPAFTIAVGLVDGFNPCAMWVLLFLLSLLVNFRDRWKIFAVAGTFVLISGLAYLAFMCAWLTAARLVILLRPAQWGLGLLGIVVGVIHIKDFFAFKKGVSLSIPDSVKPKLYDRMRRIVTAHTMFSAIAGASVLAVLVNIIELLCTAGLPAMYTGILTLQQYPAWENALYLVLYIVAYMFDDALMVAIAVITLGKNKLQERGGRILKLVSGVAIAALGVVLIARPEWLGAVE